MRSRLITPPTNLAVTLEQARMALRFEADDTSLDPVITAWLHGITAEAEKETGRALISQVWRGTADTFPEAFALRPPVLAVNAVRYLDPDGVEQTLDPADYRVDTVSEPGYVVPAPGKRWPDTQAGAVNAAWVDYTCGYGPDAASVPHAIKTYIIAKLVEQFDANASTVSNVRSAYLDRLLDQYRIWRFG